MVFTSVRGETEAQQEPVAPSYPVWSLASLLMWAWQLGGPEEWCLRVERSLLGCLMLPLPASCWLSLEGGLLYAFVGPAAVIVLVCAPSVSWEGCGPGVCSSLLSSSHLGLSLPGGHLVILSPSPYSTGPPGEYAHRNHRLQQAYGSRWHLRQVQEAEGRVRGCLCDLALWETV